VEVVGGRMGDWFLGTSFTAPPLVRYSDELTQNQLSLQRIVGFHKFFLQQPY
jgi:hypothetical protein